MKLVDIDRSEGSDDDVEGVEAPYSRKDPTHYPLDCANCGFRRESRQL